MRSSCHLHDSELCVSVLRECEHSEAMFLGMSSHLCSCLKTQASVEITSKVSLDFGQSSHLRLCEITELI